MNIKTKKEIQPLTLLYKYTSTVIYKRNKKDYEQNWFNAYVFYMYLLNLMIVLDNYVVRKNLLSTFILPQLVNFKTFKL